MRDWWVHLSMSKAALVVLLPLIGAALGWACSARRSADARIRRIGATPAPDARSSIETFHRIAGSLK